MVIRIPKLEEKKVGDTGGDIKGHSILESIPLYYWGGGYKVFRDIGSPPRSLS